MNQELTDHRSAPPPASRATLRWERDLVFQCTTPRGYDLDFDAQNEWGCLPVEALLMSLGGCLAIDVVAILTKMRVPPERFSMEMEGQREPEPPQRFIKMRLTLNIAGAGLTEEHVQRAVALSTEKYCSVHHTLRDDLEVEVVLGDGPA